MGNELVVFEAVKEVSGALTSLVKTYRETRIINKTKRAILVDRLRTCQSLQRSSAIAAIGRNNIQEIAKTMDLINDLKLTGRSLEMAMNQLDALSDALNQVLEDYKNGF